MGKWRDLFESALPPVAQRTYGEEYEFGPPATDEEIDAAEKALGITFPAEVRELLSEFNGVRFSTAVGRKNGHGPDEHLLLDTESLSIEVPDYFSDCDNPLPPGEVLRKVVWVAQSNGFGDLWGVCTEAVADHPAGAVVRLEHEVGKLKACRPNLAEFVRNDAKLS